MRRGYKTKSRGRKRGRTRKKPYYTVSRGGTRL